MATLAGPLVCLVVRCRYPHRYAARAPLCRSAWSSSSARACSSSARGTAGVRGWCAWGTCWGTSPVGCPAGRGGTASRGGCPACGRCATGSPGVTLAPRAPAPLPASRVVSPSARVGRARQVPRGRHREGATCLAVWLCVLGLDPLAIIQYNLVVYLVSEGHPIENCEDGCASRTVYFVVLVVAVVHGGGLRLSWCPLN